MRRAAFEARRPFTGESVARGPDPEETAAVLEDGWLLELGTQDELLAANGLYARLHRMQFADEALDDTGLVEQVEVPAH